MFRRFVTSKTGAGLVLTPSNADIAIPMGAYGGVIADGKVAAVPVNAAHVLAGDVIAGTTGTMYPGFLSIQMGSILLTANAISNTAAITSVVTANSIIMPLGYSTATYQGGSGKVVLTNNTTVTASRAYATGNTPLTINFLVLEFRPEAVKSKQTGEITIAQNGGYSGTSTVTSVNTSKSLLVPAGNDNNVADYGYANIILTNNTTITAARGDQNCISVITWNLLEFY